jgi:acyl transferase domain-containing protein
METETIVALLGGGGIAAIISAIVAGLFSKKKLGAEATEIITKAAAGVVTNLQAEIDRQVRARETQALEHTVATAALLASHARELDEVRRVLQLHVAWDLMAIAKLQELGIQMPPAPPLLPPRFSERHDGPDGPGREGV